MTTFWSGECKNSSRSYWSYGQGVLTASTQVTFTAHGRNVGKEKSQNGSNKNETEQCTSVHHHHLHLQPASKNKRSKHATNNKSYRERPWTF